MGKKKNVKTGGIFLINKENKLLVGHPTKHPDNVWSIPKGKLDKGEDPLTGALRETWEETNVDLRHEKIYFHQLLKQRFKNGRKILYPYAILEIENDYDFSEFDLKCNSNVEWIIGGFPEMDDYRYISISEAEDVLHHTQVACLPVIKEIISSVVKTSEEWYEMIPNRFEVIIKDPDGWDRRNWDYSFKEELVTKDEFKMRLAYSTISCKTNFFSTEW
jgi:8-oxo-dGTP pyrophosphatase MutT (NUDIX family)